MFNTYFTEGRFYAKIEVPAWINLQEKYAMLEPGGRYKPSECIARNRVAIVIPYRNREIHLKIFLNNIHTFLQRQQLDYSIFVVEMVRSLFTNLTILKARTLQYRWWGPCTIHYQHLPFLWQNFIIFKLMCTLLYVLRGVCTHRRQCPEVATSILFGFVTNNVSEYNFKTSPLNHAW